ncbi:MAG: DUF924 family protein [Marinosulfonomonas sp.]
MATPEDVLAFWLDELEPKDWYNGSPELDQKIKDRFEETWEQVHAGALGLWLTYPTGTLAYILLTDQFSRNMFRGEAKAFSTDKYALAAAKAAISRGWDMRIDEPARMFFYMPLEHSENLCDQDRSVRLMLTRLEDTRDEMLLHAKCHRDIIRRFGRFPFRNEALGRDTTDAEAEFMEGGAYGAVVQALRAKEAA